MSSLAQKMPEKLEKLNVQVHGFATEGLLFTTRNNMFTANTSDGSPAWTEAVFSMSAQPMPKLRLAAQTRYFLLGEYGKTVGLDWAQLDYRADDRIGVRVGKVKTPIGLFNEIQDIDPAYLWALLPQSIYTIESRSSTLAHEGAVVYGTLALGDQIGKVQYRVWGGRGSYSGKDGFFIYEAEDGYKLPDGIKGPEYGGALRWQTPVRGLMVGASDLVTKDWSARLYSGDSTEWGTESISAHSQPNYFALYEKDKLMVAFEYSRNWENAVFHLTDDSDSPGRNDDRGWYGMMSYKATPKLTAGFYVTQNVDRQADYGAARYQKEWVVAGRYDFTPNVYAKVEQHFIRGNGLDYDETLNPDLQPDTRLSIVKVGVSF